ncbi:hypothetical protein AC578_6227 [Pseudocercospora eumusae]|uniref:Uncharacterized protein n=1 Tax=Pseudocercospora eumusae TaxID=321146 RepID=A0A139H369_9PEZI|nr:hypothetical protein AC578_6227 [Pseudocercospora eumusae]
MRRSNSEAALQEARSKIVFMIPGRIEEGPSKTGRKLSLMRWTGCTNSSLAIWRQQCAISTRDRIHLPVPILHHEFAGGQDLLRETQPD